MKKQPVTIYTVAHEANVSMATVSRVVNGNTNVKPETRDKVLEVIKRLNYRPNAVARGLASKKTTTVGVVIPKITDDYFAELAAGIDDVAAIYKYDMILTSLDTVEQQPVQVIQSMLAKQVDGIIFMGHDLSDDLKKEFDNSAIPVLVSGSVVDDDSLPSVRIDYRQATKDSVNFLAQHGHQKIGLLVGYDQTPINAQNRIPAYQEALEAQGLVFDPANVFVGHDNYQESYQLAQQILDQRITALFVSDDLMAAGVLNALTDLGKKVPEDFEIIAGNGTATAQLTRPMLTTISQPMYDLGAVSMRLLTKMMTEGAGEDEELNVVMNHELVERQTTRADQ